MAEKEKGAAKAEAKAAGPRFTKGQLIAAKRYADRRDLLSALLEDGKQYTHAQVKNILDNFLKRKAG